MAQNTSKRLLSPDGQSLDVNKRKSSIVEAEPDMNVATELNDALLEKIQQTIKDSLENILPGLIQNAVSVALKEFSDQLMSVKKDTERLEENLISVQKDMREMKTSVELLTEKIDELEQEKRASSVVFLNEWTESKPESTVSLVKKYIKEALNVDLCDNDISRCFRMGREPKRSTKPRPILVQFASTSIKTEVLMARRHIRKFQSANYPRPVFINEDLTPRRRSTFARCRKMKKDGYIADCWTLNGRIYIKSLTGTVKSAEFSDPDPDSETETDN